MTEPTSEALRESLKRVAVALKEIGCPYALTGGYAAWAPTHAPPWVLATTHPAAVLRSRERDADYEHLVADLRVAAQALGTG